MSRRPRDNDRPQFVTFSLSPADVTALRRCARRLAFPNVEPLAVEIFHVGLQILHEQFEPTTRAAVFLRAREGMHGNRRRQNHQRG